MTETPQELIARLQEAMHKESAAHSPRTTFAIEAMRAAQTYIAASLAREAVLEQQIEDEHDNARAAYERGYSERGNRE